MIIALKIKYLLKKEKFKKDYIYQEGITPICNIKIK